MLTPQQVYYSFFELLRTLSFSDKPLARIGINETEFILGWLAVLMLEWVLCKLLTSLVTYVYNLFIRI